jgi:hypothetical protein
MQADPVTGLYPADRLSHGYDHAGNLVTEGHGQRVNRGRAGPIMHVGMANSGGAYFYQDVALTDLRDGNVLFLQGFTNFDKANTFH